MEAIIDSLENFIYGDPCKGEETVDQTHRVITTNIEGNSIEDRIQRAQVIILLEQHNHQDIEHLNGRVIRQHQNPQDFVLHEGSHKPEYLPYSLRSCSKSWDLESSTEHKSHFARLITVTHDVAFVLPTYIAVLLGDTDEETFRELSSGIRIILNDFYPEDGDERFKILEKLSPQKRLDYLMGVAKECLSELKKREDRYHAILQKEFFSRNVNLVDSIQSSLEKYSRVWVIAREAHGRYMSDGKEEKRGVAHLYQSLEAQKVGYVTLKWFDKELGEKDYSHSPEMTNGYSANEKKAAQQELQELRKQFDEEYPKSVPCIEAISISRLIEKNEGVWDIHEASDFAQVLLERTLSWAH
ncbi:MAG: hypothetical protein KDK64_00565 [Chlamydiia bacterium]|nr:hypothetical protein [Chlamydiia bacterium]